MDEDEVDDVPETDEDIEDVDEAVVDVAADEGVDVVVSVVAGAGVDVDGALEVVVAVLVCACPFTAVLEVVCCVVDVGVTV